MKKQILYTLVLLLTIIGAYSCTNTRVYTVVEQMPEYSGGEAEMHRYINKNLNMPKLEESEYCFSPSIRFVVTKKGDIRDVEIRRKDCPLSDSLASVVKNMPRWIPGQHKGKAVDVYYSLRMNIRPKY